MTPVHASGSSATAQDLSAIFGISSHKLVSTQGITASCSSSLPSSLGTVNAVGNALAGFTPPAAGRHEAWQCLATSQALGLSLQGAPPALFTLPGAASRTRLQIDSSGAKAHAQGRKLTPKSSAMLGDPSLDTCAAGSAGGFCSSPPQAAITTPPPFAALAGQTPPSALGFGPLLGGFYPGGDGCTPFSFVSTKTALADAETACESGSVNNSRMGTVLEHSPCGDKLQQKHSLVIHQAGHIKKATKSPAWRGQLVRNRDGRREDPGQEEPPTLSIASRRRIPCAGRARAEHAPLETDQVELAAGEAQVLVLNPR